jgi:hypothetical protein
MSKTSYSYLKLILIFFFLGPMVFGQLSPITGASISDDNLKINIVFDQEIYSNSSCSTLTCIEINDFSLSLSGGSATLASTIPITITKLGNYNFTNQWNNPPVEPNNSGGNEDWAQHVSTGLLNDLNENTNNLNGVLEIIEPNQRAIPGYTYITSYPIGLSCAHSYYRSTTADSWSAEKLKAQNAGGDLLVYNSLEEFNYMVPGFNDNTTGVGNTWIGLSQDRTAQDYSEPRGGWYWDDGTPIDNSAAPLTYQITIALNGIPDGDEIVTVNPVTAPFSIFNCAGVSAISQTNRANVVGLNDMVDPYIVSAQMSDDNSTVRVVFNEPIFTDGTNPILNTDFTLSLNQNGSTANLNSVNPTSIAIYGRVIDLNLPMNGLPITGKEVLTILPSVGSILDDASNVASSTQTNNIVNFNPPKTGPVYLSNIYKTSVVSGTITIAEEGFLCNEIQANNYNQAYHDGIIVEPQIGNYLIYNRRYSYPSQLVDGSDLAYFHLRGFDQILEVQKSDGLIVAKYSCN